MALLPILIGSKSDHKFMTEGLTLLKDKGVGHFVMECSVHRKPEEAIITIEGLTKGNPEVIIAGAATATGLPGITAGYLQKYGILILGVRFSHEQTSIMEDMAFNLSAMPKGVPLAYCGYNEKGFLHACMMAINLIEI